jgi:hypothetical protein
MSHNDQSIDNLKLAIGNDKAHPYRSREKNVRLESALVRLARNQVTWGEMGRLRIVEW